MYRLKTFDQTAVRMEEICRHLNICSYNLLSLDCVGSCSTKVLRRLCHRIKDHAKCLEDFEIRAQNYGLSRIPLKHFDIPSNIKAC